MSHTLASWRRTLTLIMALAVMAGLMVGISTAPAEASLGQVCKVRVTFAIGGDDIRGNTIIQVAAGGKSFTVSAGIGDWTTDVREGEFSGCISHSELKTTGFLITSISNPSWPETTDNWNLRGISIIDPDTGRGYFTQLLSGDDIHRFTGEEPSFRFNVEVDEQKPFFDHRYAHCSDDQMFARFVDPLNPNNPMFEVRMARADGGPVIDGSFSRFNDWGGSLAGLRITNANDASIRFFVRTPDGRTGEGTISFGCNPVGV